MENHDHGMEISSLERNNLNGISTTTEISAQEYLPVPIFSTVDILDTNCIDEPNVHSDIPVISKVFKDIFEQRITAIENNNNLDEHKKNKEKLTVLLQHNKELQDQNDTFVSTLLELEKEAQQRVKQMEKRLKSSAKTTMEAVINVHDCAKEMKKIVEERIYVESLYNDMQQHVSNFKEENAFLRDQNCNLNHDIQALLQVIQHARSTGHWEMNCVTFCEVTPEQVFGPVQSISNLCTTDFPQPDFQPEHERNISNNSSQEIINSSTSSMCIVHCERNQVNDKNKRIAFLESQLSELQHRLALKDAECECHLWKLEMLIQQNRNRMELLPTEQQCSGNSLLKGISLPEIGNIYSFAHDESSCSCTSSEPDIENDDRIVCSKTDIKKNKYSLSISVQTDETVTFSVGLQAAIKREGESGCMCSCSDPGVNSFNEKIVQELLGKDFLIPKEVVSPSDNVSATTEDEMKEKGFKRDIHQMINIMQNMKESLVKAEDKAAAKEILLSQLQGHLTSAVKEVELKDTALNNLEKKLDASRNESRDLKNQISQILKDLEDMKVLNDNLLLKVNAKEDKIQEMSMEQKILQDQKRTLLTQLDSQGDELHKTKEELVAMIHNAKSCASQVEQQTQIIRNLQEALVQSKRAFDASHRKGLWEVSSPQNESKSSSKSSIVDI